MSRKEWKRVFVLLGSLSEKHKDVLISMVLQGILAGLHPFVAVVLTGMLVDAVYAGREMAELMRYVAVSVGVICLLQTLEGIVTMYFNRKLEYMQEIQAGPLNEKSMRMDYEYLENVDVQEMRQRLEQLGDWSLTSRLLSLLNKITRNLTTIVVAVIVAVPMLLQSGRSLSRGFVGSWLMGVLFLAAVVLLVLLEFKLGRHFNGRVTESRKEMSGYESRKKYYLAILADPDKQKDLRMCKQQGLYEREFWNVARGIKQVANKVARYDFYSIFTEQTISAATGFLVYAYTGILACAGLISVGGVVTYAASVLKFTASMGSLVYLLSVLGGNAGRVQDYVDYMALSQRKHEGTIPVEKRRDDRFTVEFDHVSFKYPGRDNYVIRDLSLKFEIGEKMAIVGKNGSGKTTFIKLLCRLYDVTEGCIRVNGIDIRKYNYAEYCNLFAVVFQDFQVFALPLGENVAAGAEVEAERAEAALERAGLGERYRALADGLHTGIGKEFAEEGVAFSGGEKQKIAIARAIYKNAPFVIMDEPTAALDPESECQVYAGFDRMVGKKTAIYISHRLASCRFCQDILVFDQGRVVQRGRHEELEHQEGLYRELWNAQAQYYA